MSSEPRPTLDRLLASASFQRSRRAAARIADDASALVELLGQVAAHEFGIGQLPDISGGIDIDIACAVVEAHIDELASGTADDGTAIADARCRLVIAALHYLVDTEDVIPDRLPSGHIDDVVVMRWATRVARGEVPTQ